VNAEDLEKVLPEQRLLNGLVLGVGVAFGLALAYVFGGGMSLVGNGSFETIDGYAFMISLLVGSLVPVSYWLYFRDVSEAVAVFLGMVWALFFGLQDLFVYLVSSEYSVPDGLPWLSDSPVGMVAGVLGFGEVSRSALYLVVFLTGIGLLVLVKILEDVEKRFLGVNL
jgi:hypothetical protein